MSKSVVIVEDEFLIAQDFIGMCEDMGIEVLGHAASAEEARDLIARTEPEYILMDVRIRGKRDGVDVAYWVHETYPATKIIFVTGSNEPPTIERIHTDHPHTILIKPISFTALKNAFS